MGLLLWVGALVGLHLDSRLTFRKREWSKTAQELHQSKALLMIFHKIHSYWGLAPLGGEIRQVLARLHEVALQKFISRPGGIRIILLAVSTSTE